MQQFLKLFLRWVTYFKKLTKSEKLEGLSTDNPFNRSAMGPGEVLTWGRGVNL
jgi:hypothetical protein